MSLRGNNGYYPRGRNLARMFRFLQRGDVCRYLCGRSLSSVNDCVIAHAASESEPTATSPR